MAWYLFVICARRVIAIVHYTSHNHRRLGVMNACNVQLSKVLYFIHPFLFQGGTLILSEDRLRLLEIAQVPKEHVSRKIGFRK